MSTEEKPTAAAPTAELKVKSVAPATETISPALVVEKSTDATAAAPLAIETPSLPVPLPSVAPPVAPPVDPPVAAVPNVATPVATAPIAVVPTTAVPPVSEVTPPVAPTTMAPPASKVPPPPAAAALPTTAPVVAIKPAVVVAAAVLKPAPAPTPAPVVVPAAAIAPVAAIKPEVVVAAALKPAPVPTPAPVVTAAAAIAPVEAIKPEVVVAAAPKPGPVPTPAPVVAAASVALTAAAAAPSTQPSATAPTPVVPAAAQPASVPKPVAVAAPVTTPVAPPVPAATVPAVAIPVPAVAAPVTAAAVSTAPVAAASVPTAPTATAPAPQAVVHIKPAPVPDAVASAPAPVAAAKPMLMLVPSPVLSSVATARHPSAPPASGPTPNAVTSMPPRGVAAAPKSKKKKGPPPPPTPPLVTMATAPIAQASVGAQGENTGRWTSEEHRLFLQGLEQHGKGWKKIASLIKSRTVVQIRTHAQKYFQKLAKARQNGEEGDVTMEGRGGVADVLSVTSAAAAHKSKRRRLTTGTKRKAIHSVVVSAQRQGKKLASAQATAGVPNPVAPLPTVAPVLAHFLLPHTSNASGGCAMQGVSGPALEDSLFRFLTPAPILPIEGTQVNNVARQAGANPTITLPADNPSSTPNSTGGEISPTGVDDLVVYPTWTDVKDPPSWYANGADVDALLDMADTLDWLEDTGDLHETYQPQTMESGANLDGYDSHKIAADLGHTAAMNSTSVSTLPHVDSNVESVVPPLPSLFDGTTPSEPLKKLSAATLSTTQLAASTSAANMEAHMEVFDTPMEEHDFVSTILENNNESTDSLPVMS